MTRAVLLSLTMAAALAGCAYEPPVADRSRPSYAADLQACQDSVPAAVNTQNAKTGLAWFSSPFRRSFQIRDGMRGCMAAKGYAVTS